MTIRHWIRRIVALRMTIVPSAISRVSSRASASRVIDFRTRIGRSGSNLFAWRTNSPSSVNLQAARQWVSRCATAPRTNWITGVTLFVATAEIKRHARERERERETQRGEKEHEKAGNGAICRARRVSRPVKEKSLRGLHVSVTTAIHGGPRAGRMSDRYTPRQRALFARTTVPPPLVGNQLSASIPAFLRFPWRVHANARTPRGPLYAARTTWAFRLQIKRSRVPRSQLQACAIRQIARAASPSEGS